MQSEDAVTLGHILLMDGQNNLKKKKKGTNAQKHISKLWQLGAEMLPTVPRKGVWQRLS